MVIVSFSKGRCTVVAIVIPAPKPLFAAPRDLWAVATGPPLHSYSPSVLLAGDVGATCADARRPWWRRAGSLRRLRRRPRRRQPLHVLPLPARRRLLRRGLVPPLQVVTLTLPSCMIQNLGFIIRWYISLRVCLRLGQNLGRNSFRLGLSVIGIWTLEME